MPIKNGPSPVQHLLHGKLPGKHPLSLAQRCTDPRARSCRTAPLFRPSVRLPNASDVQHADHAREQARGVASDRHPLPSERDLHRARHSQKTIRSARSAVRGRAQVPMPIRARQSGPWTHTHHNNDAHSRCNSRQSECPMNLRRLSPKKANPHETPGAPLSAVASQASIPSYEAVSGTGILSDTRRHFLPTDTCSRHRRLQTYRLKRMRTKKTEPGRNCTTHDLSCSSAISSIPNPIENPSVTLFRLLVSM